MYLSDSLNKEDKISCLLLTIMLIYTSKLCDNPVVLGKKNSLNKKHDVQEKILDSSVMDEPVNLQC